MLKTRVRLKISCKQYERYMLFSRKISRNRDADELLHEVIMKVLSKPEPPNKDAYIYTALRNTMYDKNSSYNKLRNPKPTHFDQEQTDYPEFNHVFLVLEQLKTEGLKKEADIFLQSYFCMTQKQVAKKIGKSQRYVAGCCRFVKDEIKKRYENN